jgi:K+-sensing histidine kinase KdpD
VDDPKEFGVNLMACYFLVYHHGGKIAVKSQPGRGTVFTISIPLKPKEITGGANDKEFLSRVLMNDALWEKLLAGV